MSTSAAEATPPSPRESARLQELERRAKGARGLLKKAGADFWIAPVGDPHMSEMPAERFERLEYLSGFSGSNGTGLFPADPEATPRLWTDGRYFVQAKQQLPPHWTLMKEGQGLDDKIDVWLPKNLAEGQAVALDPTLHSISFVLKLKEDLEAKGMKLVLVDDNIIDGVWGDARPSIASDPVKLHPLKYAGVSAAEKLREIRTEMATQNADYLIVSALDEVCYLFNLRGGDVPRTPVMLSYAVVFPEAEQGKSAEDASCALLFVDEAKITPDVRKALDEAKIQTKPYSEAFSVIGSLCADQEKKVWMPRDGTNFKLCDALGAERIKNASAKDSKWLDKPSPVAAMKAIKNEAEVAGMVEAHLKDGVALTRAFSKLEAKVRAGETITEVGVDELVTSSRAADPGFLDTSFDTIAGFGEHGAIVHYRASDESASKVTSESMLLVDSGGQYAEGTTDITRTMHFGTPTDEEKECFTRVLQGHIGMALATFPEDTPGFIVDAFARAPLWNAGLDYRHGTGHGVGAVLGVHEGPQRISTNYDCRVGLKKGMIVSNEPGYYKDGHFGIRIENLMVIVEKNTPSKFGGKSYLGFESLTWVPFQTSLVKADLLSDAELNYLNTYNQQVQDKILPRLQDKSDEAAKEWLIRSTEPLCR